MPDNAAKIKSPRWVKILLVVSLALNFIFVGASVGFLLRGSGHRSAISRDVAFQIARAMPQQDRRELLRDFRQRRNDIAAEYPDFREHRDMIIEILRESPFDPDALLAVLSKQRERGLRVAAIGHEAVVSRLNEMPDSERKTVARNLHRRPNRNTR